MFNYTVADKLDQGQAIGDTVTGLGTSSPTSIASCTASQPEETSSP